jgi:hypothetical protein
MEPASADTPCDALLREFCEALGLADWKSLAESQHLIVDEHLVGLIPQLDAETPMLSMCVELGQSYPCRDAALYQRLLEANLTTDGLAGHYGLHPETLQVVYLMQLPLDTLTGVGLANLLAEVIRTRGIDAASPNE